MLLLLMLLMLLILLMMLMLLPELELFCDLTVCSAMTGLKELSFAVLIVSLVACYSLFAICCLLLLLVDC